MHELSVAQALCEQIQEQIVLHGIKKVNTIRLRIGQMRGVIPECLEFYLEVLLRDTPAEAAKVLIEHVPLRIHCRTCNADSRLDDIILLCPQCGGSDVEVIEGKELVFESMEAET